MTLCSVFNVVCCFEGYWHYSHNYFSWDIDSFHWFLPVLISNRHSISCRAAFLSLSGTYLVYTITTALRSNSNGKQGQSGSRHPESILRRSLTFLASSCITAELDIHDLMLDGNVVLLWTVHTSAWTLQPDVVSTRQWPCWVTHTQYSVGSWASRLRLCVKELTSLSGRSDSLHLKSFPCASFRSTALPAWPTARPPTCLVCQLLMMRMMEGIK